MAGLSNNRRVGAPQVERVESFLVDMPIIRPHKLAMATMQAQTMLIVRIHCSDGSVGIGEGTTIGGLAYGPESPESMKTAEFPRLGTT